VAWQTGGRFRRIRAATAPLTAAPHPHSPSVEEARLARGCWRLATTSHWRAPRGAHADGLRGAASRALGGRHAASVRPTHGGAGHRAPHRRTTPPQPRVRRGVAGASLLAAGDGAALAGATRRARTPSAGRRQSAFGAAPRRLSAPHARRRRPPRPSPPRHTPSAPLQKRRGWRVGAGGWQQRRTGGRHAACTHTGCGAPPVGLWGGATPPQCAPRTAAPGTTPRTAAPHLHSPSLEEARQARGCWRLATAPHWRAPRGVHAHRLRGAASWPLGRRHAASVRPTHDGAGHARRRIPDHTLGCRSVPHGVRAESQRGSRQATISASPRRLSAPTAAVRGI